MAAEIVSDNTARDFVQHCLVAELARTKTDSLVFKGGTYLRVCMFSEYRFSEDLDFDWVGTDEEFTKLLTKATERASRKTGTFLNFGETVRKRKFIDWEALDFRGKIKVEAILLDTGDELPPTKKIGIIPRWKGIGNGLHIRGYTPLSVASDKLKCIARRPKSRDFYDLHRLLTENRVRIIDAWDEYLQTWQNPKREFGKRPHPVDIVNSYSGRRGRLEEDWKRLSDEESFPDGTPPFSVVYETVDSSIRQVWKQWKASFPPGHLHAKKLEHYGKTDAR